MKRGELWVVAGGVYASKPRPALVIQDDVFDDLDSVSVIPLTSALEQDVGLLRIRIAADEMSGLEHTSDLMVDKLTTVPRRNVRVRLGRLASQQLVEVERSLMTFLGLAR